jgi:hypothetical protein
MKALAYLLLVVGGFAHGGALGVVMVCVGGWMLSTLRPQG